MQSFEFFQLVSGVRGLLSDLLLSKIRGSVPARSCLGKLDDDLDVFRLPLERAHEFAPAARDA